MRRHIAHALTVLRMIPAVSFIGLGSITVPLMLLFVPGWKPLLTIVNFALLGYGGWRAIRRQRALGWTAWKP